MPAKLTQEKILEIFENVHSDKYDYSKVNYRNMRTKVRIKCKKHGWFEKIPPKHMNGQGCMKCVIEGKYLTIEKFIERSREIHGDYYDYSLVDYKHSQQKVKIICPEHRVFRQTPTLHMGGFGCSKCGNDNVRLTQKEVLKRFYKAHGNKYDYSLINYTRGGYKVKIVCPDHGVFEQRASCHWEGQGCPQCRTLTSETEVIKFVSRMFGLKFQKVKPKWLRGYNCQALELDGFNPRFKFGIEYQGQQHYMRGVNGTHFFTREKVKGVQKNDRRKLQMCRTRGICLIRVPYFEWQDTEDRERLIKSLIRQEFAILHKQGHRNITLRQKL